MKLRRLQKLRQRGIRGCKNTPAPRADVYEAAGGVTLTDKVGILLGRKVSPGLLSVLPGEIDVVLFALRPLLRARAKAERSNKVGGKELQ